MKQAEEELKPLFSDMARKHGSCLNCSVIVMVHQPARKVLLRSGPVPTRSRPSAAGAAQ